MPPPGATGQGPHIPPGPYIPRQSPEPTLIPDVENTRREEIEKELVFTSTDRNRHRGSEEEERETEIDRFGVIIPNSGEAARKRITTEGRRREGGFYSFFYSSKAFQGTKNSASTGSRGAQKPLNYV